MIFTVNVRSVEIRLFCKEHTMTNSMQSLIRHAEATRDNNTKSIWDWDRVQVCCTFCHALVKSNQGKTENSIIRCRLDFPECCIKKDEGSEHSQQ